MTSIALETSPDLQLLTRFQRISSFQTPSEVSKLAVSLSSTLPQFHRFPEAQNLLKSGLSCLFSHIFTLVVQNPSLIDVYITLLKTVIDFDRAETCFLWLSEAVKMLGVKTQLTLLEMDSVIRRDLETHPQLPLWSQEEWWLLSEEAVSKVPARRKCADSNQNPLLENGRKPPFQERFKIVLPLNFALVQFVPLTSQRVLQAQRFESYLLEVASVPYKLTLRPDLDPFLTELSTFSELWLYAETTPEEVYKVLEVIDPTKRFFQRRVITEVDESGKKARRFLPVSDEDLDLVLVLETRMEAWRDLHERMVLISPFAPSAVPPGLPQALDYQLLDPCYGPPIISPVVCPSDWNLFAYLKPALKQVYLQFLSHKTELTAAYEFRLFRRQVLEGVAVHLQTYISRLGQAGYTTDRLRSIRVIVREMGMIETDGSGLEVVEGTSAQQTQVSVDSLLKAFYRCSRL